MQAALEVNIPNYASALVTTDEVVAAVHLRAEQRTRTRVIAPVKRISYKDAVEIIPALTVYQ